jgi:ribonuclease III
MLEDTKAKGNKGFNKVLGDVFEAYVAAVIKSDPENGFATAEKWLTTLWMPKLDEATKHDRIFSSRYNEDSTNSPVVGALKVYNPNAKADLQKRIFGGQDTKLSYEKYRDSVELKGAQLGQNRHFIALYLTGYGYERKLLGKGEGANKVEAGNWAAQQAMFGEAKSIVDECEEKLKLRKEESAKKRSLQVKEAGNP